MDSKRLEYIDGIRLLGCYLVILHHSDMPVVKEENRSFTMFMSLLSSSSSELFLTISGALLLPSYLRMRDFYTKRFSRLVYPVIF